MSQCLLLENYKPVLSFMFELGRQQMSVIRLLGLTGFGRTLHPVVANDP